jgi:serine/threonine protein kinase/tetratricopeptide (TPR) repeat protein
MTVEKSQPGRHRATHETTTIEHDQPASAMEVAHWHTGISASDDSGPTKIGRFIVLERIGAGAMGEVYAAYDNQLDRKVALKVVHPARGPSTLIARERLLREAQTLARLSHPNVVQVYEIGLLQDQVFLVMEFIRGRTLDAWLHGEIRDRIRQWRLILDTYVAAGRGLAAAHDAGLIHRDFKPVNVLVGEDGRVHVVDFGLARLEEIAPDPSLGLADTHEAEFPDMEDRGRLTRTGAILGTPAYMSPEQMDGRETDRRSDQFSFCVALYEALYGARPFSGGSFHLLRKAIADGPPREPPRGHRVPARIWRALVRGLAEDPETRHPSITALLEVLVEPQTPRRRWMTRLATTAIGGMLAGSIIVLAMRPSGSQATLCQGSDAKLATLWNERARTAMNAAFLATGRGHASSTYERTTGLIDAYGQRWVAARVDACEATHKLGEQSEEVLDLRMMCLDGRLQRMDMLIRALTRDVQAGGVDAAIEAVLALPGLEGCSDVASLKQAYPMPPGAAERQSIEESQELLDGIQTALDMGQGNQLLDRAEEARRRAELTEFPPLQARAHWLLATVQELNERYEDAEANLWAAARLAATSRDDHLTANAWIDLVNVVGYRQGRLGDARHIIPFAEAMLLRAGNDALLQARLARSLGWFYATSGDYVIAQQHYERVIDILQRRHGHGSLEATVSRLALSASYGLAAVFSKKADYARAQAQYEHIRELVQTHFGPDHVYLINLNGVLAETLIKRGKLDAAEALLRQAIDMERTNHGATTSIMGRLLERLGTVLMREQKLDASKELLTRGIEILLDAYGPQHWETAHAMYAMAGLEIQRKQYEEAATWLERSRAAYEASLSTKVPHLRWLLARARLLLGRSRLQEARQDFQRVLALMEQTSSGLLQPEVGEALIGLGDVSRYLGESSQALHHYEKARGVFEQIHGSDHPSVGSAWLSTAEMLLDQHRHAEARGHFESAHRILAHAPPAELARVLVGLSEARLAESSSQEDLALAERALELAQQAGDQHAIAWARFILARAYWAANRDRKHAVSLARTAHDELPAQSVRDAALRRRSAAVTTWLAGVTAASP